MHFVLYNMQVHCLAIVIYSGIPWVLPIMLLASGVSPALHTHSKEQKHLRNVIVFVKVLMYSHDCFPWLYALKYYLTMTVMCMSILWVYIHVLSMYICILTYLCTLHVISLILQFHNMLNIAILCKYVLLKCAIAGH